MTYWSAGNGESLVQEALAIPTVTPGGAWATREVAAAGDSASSPTTGTSSPGSLGMDDTPGAGTDVDVLCTATDTLPTPAGAAPAF